MNNQISNRICISREIEGNRIEIWINDEEEFSRGFRTLSRLCERVKIEQAKIHLENYWVSADGSDILSNEIEEGPHRVAISLFMSWPSCKRPVDIQNETELSSGSVSNILVGRQGNQSSWFKRCADGWMLTEQGLVAIFEEIISPTFEN